ncbi:small RNA 2'-O-methyltransferase [Malaya genurostris]|uniref:small RNA 2'-O-methyltransferase n=1 Tax=Malaya genurostris TaxID=325434 RepID=UPI0026F3CB74|nr:small RNA 2'-O-methyltransferase [Malaya genurostris]
MDKIKPKFNYDNSCYYDECKKIRFDPPVYEQRYLVVLRLLELDFWKDHFKKVVEFGCAEMKFFTLLKTLPGLEQILQVDIDEELLTKWTYTVRPLFIDYIQRRSSKFSVEVWRGSIAAPHECLRDTDVVIGIELIEHLFPEVLEAVPQNVFGFIRPKVAIFSTPNAEYNVHFDGLLENGFRHEDHKFEWTRAQFQEWCENICQRYPDYAVKYFGIGPPPKDSADVGYVSQLCLFVRKDFLEQLQDFTKDHNVGSTANEALPVDLSTVVPSTSNEVEAQSSEPKIYFSDEVGEIVVAREGEEEPVDVSVERRGLNAFSDDFEDAETYDDEIESSDQDEPNFREIDFYLPVERARNDSGNYDDEPLDPTSDEYKLLYSVDYPVQEPDRRNRTQQILDEAEYQIRRLKFQDEQFYNYEDNQYSIPLQLVANCLNQVTATVVELRPILEEASYRISEQDMVVLNGDDESVIGSEEDFEYGFKDSEEFSHGDRNDQPVGNDGAVNNGSNEGTVFKDDEELWD